MVKISSSIIYQVPLVPQTSNESTRESFNQNSISTPRTQTTSTNTTQSLTKGFGLASNIETLVAASKKRATPIEAPTREVQDKIYSMINNSSPENIEANAKEFSNILEEKFYPWFAQYMIIERVSIQPYCHELYLKFLDIVDSTNLNKEIIQASYENCKVLIGSKLLKTSSEERLLLKNLGTWLGKLTIGRNKMLCANEIDLKTLIVEAYEKGLMIAIVPFTSKILEPCRTNLLSLTPNPWTTLILGLLAEIHTMVNLKMNLIFEIETLFKKLCLELRDIRPTSLLKDLKRETEENPDFTNQMASSQSNIVLPANPPNPGGNRKLLPQSVALCLSEKIPSATSRFQTSSLEPPSFYSQVDLLHKEWYQISLHSPEDDAACINYVLQLHEQGLLECDDLTERVFHLLMKISVQKCVESEERQSNQQLQNLSTLSFINIDIFAKLVFSILKYWPNEQDSNNLFFLSKILTMAVKFIQKDLKVQLKFVDPRPYFRLFINWLLDIGSLAFDRQGSNFQILTTFADAFHALQPLNAPGFTFAWLELISHFSFMPKLLTRSDKKGWLHVLRLLEDLLQFLKLFEENGHQRREAIHFLYKGTLKVMVLLLHDFPDFLCDFHFALCEVIHPSYVQMRNVVLSASPSGRKMTDPFTPITMIQWFPEIREPPAIHAEVDAALRAHTITNCIDEYLKTANISSFLRILKQKLFLPPREFSDKTRYNVPLINSLVLYAGKQSIQSSDGRNIAAILDMFRILNEKLDTEGRYLFLCAIANQMRYPNSHTIYFSRLLLYLYTDGKQEIIQEQITRVLLERVIAKGPRPWGLLVTFVVLVKYHGFNIWKQDFIRRYPAIQQLIASAIRSLTVEEDFVLKWISNEMP